MAKTTQDYLGELKELYEEYDEVTLKGAIGVGSRQIQKYLAGAEVSPERIKQIRESFVKHQRGEPIFIEEKDGFKDKYIASLERERDGLVREKSLLENELELRKGEMRHIAIMNNAILRTLRKAVAQLIAKQEKEDLLKVAHRLSRESNESYEILTAKGILSEMDK